MVNKFAMLGGMARENGREFIRAFSRVSELHRLSLQQEYTP